MSAEKICVVGSGPAGATAAHFLWHAGFDVTVLDGGLRAEPEVVSDIADWLEKPDDAKLKSAVAQRRSSSTLEKPDLAEKLFLGSDFVYRETERELLESVENADIRASLAQGGLSNVWGAAALPITAQDIADWPISQDDLSPHYQSLNEIIDIVGDNDGLEKSFGTNVVSPSFSLGRQASALLEDMASHASDLHQSGFEFGRARVAVGNKFSHQSEGCVSCGHCMIGCPHGAIFNSAFVIDTLKGRERFTYQGRRIVDQVAETVDGVTVSGHGLIDGSAFSQRFERVFIAAGVVSTAAIMLRSRRENGGSLQLRDSQLFVFPIIRYRGEDDVALEKTNRLAQLFIELNDPNLCDRLIHLQLYGFNDVFMDAITEKLGPLASIAPFILKFLTRHAMIVQGFLHSDYSGSIRVSLSKSGKANLTGEPNEQSEMSARKTQKYFVQSRPHFRATPIPGQIVIPPPGASRHLGASLPMSASPKIGESDLLGRPDGLKRVHVVDASVLPSIPASTITYTAMANAARIVGETARLPEVSI
ncbi:MAG: hypothetical protein CMM52_17160 [Rhodospirillaceae bacterium]|nr:hypothetical protein [Rhodospirillaceae bacterium]